MTTRAKRAAFGDADALLLDEMFSPRVATLLGAQDIDCASVAANELLRASDDESVLLAALDHSRVLVTNNVIDFERLRRTRSAAGLAVPSLICTDDSTFPRGRAFVDRLASALAVAAGQHLPAAHGGVLWLSPAD